MRVTIVGTGYVGLVTGTCLADFGLKVICVDNNQKKIEQLKKGIVPIYEPYLEELIKKNVQENRLTFTTDIKEAIQESQVIFIAVGTPPNGDGSASLIYVEEVARDIARYLNGYKVIVNKCTVPVGTAQKIKKIISENYSLCHCNSSPSGHCNSSPSVIARSEATKQSQFNSLPSKMTDGNEAVSASSSSSPLTNQSAAISFDIVSNPEFLREGSAIRDFTHPDKIVIGYESEKARQIMEEIYRPLYLLDRPFVFTTLETAEMIKYACNAFLATKITFMNEIANLCDRVGADVHQIAKAMGMDGRISPKFLHPGPGYGGSCFPKDTMALQATANEYDYDFKLIKAVIQANACQREIVVEKIEKTTGNLKGKTIAVLGLAFKQNTDDIRESAAIDIIKILIEKGAHVQCFDPMAMENTREILPDLTYCQDEYETAKDADALVILTEWNQFRNLDLNKIKYLMKDLTLFDFKNLYEPDKVKQLGFKYHGIGRN